MNRDTRAEGMRLDDRKLDRPRTGPAQVGSFQRFSSRKNLNSPQAKNDRQTGQDARRDETRNDEKTYRATDKQVPQSCLYIPATS